MAAEKNQNLLTRPPVVVVDISQVNHQESSIGRLQLAQLLRREETPIHQDVKMRVIPSPLTKGRGAPPSLIKGS